MKSSLRKYKRSIPKRQAYSIREVLSPEMHFCWFNRTGDWVFAVSYAFNLSLITISKYILIFGSPTNILSILNEALNIEHIFVGLPMFEVYVDMVIKDILKACLSL